MFGWSSEGPSAWVLSRHCVWVGSGQPAPVEGLQACSVSPVRINLIAFLRQLACVRVCLPCTPLIEWLIMITFCFLKRMLGRHCVLSSRPWSICDDNGVLLIGSFREIPLDALLAAVPESCFLLVSYHE